MTFKRWLLLFCSLNLGILICLIGSYNNWLQIGDRTPPKKNLIVELALNKSRYTEGEPIEITVSFSNFGKEAIWLSAEEAITYYRYGLVFESFGGASVEPLADERAMVFVGSPHYLDVNETCLKRIFLQNYLSCHGTGSFRVRWTLTASYRYDRNVSAPYDEEPHVTYIEEPRSDRTTFSRNLLPSWSWICNRVRILQGKHFRDDRVSVHQGYLAFTVYPSDKEQLRVCIAGFEADLLSNDAHSEGAFTAVTGLCAVRDPIVIPHLKILMRDYPEEATGALTYFHNPKVKRKEEQEKRRD